MEFCPNQPGQKAEMTFKQELISAYRRYGFTLARDNAKDDLLVFTLKTGYFDNAEIIKLNPNTATDPTFREFTSAGYACTIREAKNPELAEEELFNGFFSASSTRDRLLDDYKRFTSSLVHPYGPSAKYEYIRGPYQINGKEGTTTPPDEVISRIDDDQPILFLIEAAAGFGKTCTAQEIARLLAEHPRRLPLYAELSRNRQARIFRYILLDEIDRTFPLLSSNLVQTEIKNGRIAAILDGFDELLRKGEDQGDFENKEPMLETVSELLTGRAKVIITTRRTALFDGDEFHQWLDNQAGAFQVIRIRIQEPKVSDWIPHDRLEALERAGLDIGAMANPVLLSYLRCIDESTFHKAATRPEEIVQSYFNYMLEREIERQDLRMTVITQSNILHSIAGDMIKNGYTAEERDYIIKFIIETKGNQLEASRNQYPATDRPSREEIANKLAGHALLDRSSADSGKIGFVNEFALGNYVADNILADPNWLGDDMRFIDPAVRSYAPRGENSRHSLYSGLMESLPFLDLNAQVEVSSKLTNKLPKNLADGAIEGLELSNLTIGEERIHSFQFGEVTFQKCEFRKANLEHVTFLNCRFFDCNILEEEAAGPIYVLGCISAPDIAQTLASTPAKESDPLTESRAHLLDCIILKKFWPIGDPISQKPSRPIYKPLKFLLHPIDNFSTAELYECVERLKRNGILSELNKSNLISLNFENIPEAQKILEGENK